MNAIAVVMVVVSSLGAAAGDGAAVAGRIVDPDGEPIAGARVFLEPGLADPLIEARSGPDGAFRFDDVPPGLVGVLAIADGFAYGGTSVMVRVAETVSDIEIELSQPGSVQGRVVNTQGEPVAGAQATPVLLLGTAKVGVPLAKLTLFGEDDCLTDEDGRFTLGRLPEGGKVALKISHALYAQEAFPEVPVGEENLRVTLESGVVVEGTVLARDSAVPVANAGIAIANARPPHDTVLTRTEYGGRFMVRLKPGVYSYRAAGNQLSSPGWEKLTVTGRQQTQPVTLYVAGTAEVHGQVLDAASGEPVAGAKLVLLAFGNRAAVATTGPSGEYCMAAVEGENVVRLESAPGYMLPQRSAIRVQAVQGRAVELDPFWLAAIPEFNVQIVDEESKPVPGVIVTLVRPRQYRWRVSDADGRVRLSVASIEAGTRVIGRAEHPDRPLGALFALRREDAADARVQLLPLSAVKGQAADDRGRPIEGAVVGGLFQDDPDDEPIALWHAVSGKDGVFRWEGLVPFVPMVCVAFAGPEHSGRSMPFTLEPASEKDIGRVVIIDGEGTSACLGRPLPWYENRLVSGPLPDAAARAARPAVIMYCTPAGAEMMLDALEAMRRHLGDDGLVAALVVDGPAPIESDTIPVLRGPAPGPATTYLVNADQTVAFEFMGMPPVWALQRLRARQ
ncbi:MAG: carboxypeptidase regulatory-like domain-containing protein [Candidatus Hydrogenedentes bacterium]|nr:carboxypeptidase regulatory-like domain-containing protein [Candidatus Hydrogenedentota bacterium]